MSSVQDKPGVIAPPPLLFGIFFGVAILFQWIHSLAIPLLPKGMDWPAMVLINLSAIIFLWAAVWMWRARTNINPLLPTTSLVTSGPYRFSRNPLSVSLVVLYIGMSLRLDTLWPLLLFVPLLIVFHYGVIQREERYLERKFGDTYRNYCVAVRRWI
jgi:protein-S-isoprenylcysteine O-methyltransferase Ste14